MRCARAAGREPEREDSESRRLRVSAAQAVLASDAVPMWATSPVALLCAWMLDAPCANGQGGNGIAESGGANATCALAFTTEKALYKRIQLESAAQLLAEDSVGSVVFSVALIVIGVVLLTTGYRVFKGVLFSAGFIGGFMVSLTATSALFNMSPQLFNCWALTVVPVVAGLILGSLALNIVRIFFIVVGATAGGVIGWYAYTSLSLTVYAKDGESTDWLYYACLGIPAIAGGCSGAKLEEHVVAVATSAVGGFAFMIGLDFLVLRSIDDRFTRWISMLSATQGVDKAAQFDFYILIPMLAAVLLSILGAVWQLRMLRYNNYSAPMAYGGKNHTSSDDAHM